MSHIIATILIFIATFYFLRKLLTSKLPPGPWGLPFIGYAPFLGVKPHEVYAGLAKKYGPIFTVSLFSRDWIILNSREVIEEAFVKQGKATSGRVPNPVLDVTNGRTPAFAHGHFWKTQREFEMKAMKAFGTDAMEEKIRGEFDHLQKYLTDKREQPCECQVIIAKAISNVTIEVMAGARIPYEDPRFDSVANVAGFNVSGAEDSKHFGLMIAMPFLRHIPPFKKSYVKLVSSENDAADEMGKLIQDRKTPNYENSGIDFVDRFLREMNRDGSDKTFNETQLHFSIVNLIAASSDTTTNTLRWSIIAMLNYPKYQRKLAKEIAEMVERTGEVSLRQKDDLPLTRAFVHEIWRYCTLLPLALPHMTLSKIRLQGYQIPKGTPIVANYWAVHRNKKLFKNPDEFFPERFIGEDGQFIPDDNVVPFSVGSRRCIGELLARIEPILFLAKLLEKFEILLPDGTPVPSMEDGMLAISYAPKEFSVIFRNRVK